MGGNLGKKWSVRLSYRNISRLGLNCFEAYIILPENTDEQAEIRADSEYGPVLRLLPYEEALELLVS